MPQILVADVRFAARLQSLDFVKNYVAKVQNFPESTKLFSDYFCLQSVFFEAAFPLSHFPTFDICIFRFREAESFNIIYIIIYIILIV